jgi:putative phosphonate metabolism protein
MTDTPRYAIYYAPAHLSDLDRLGAHLLGYDAFNGEALMFADGIEKAVPDWLQITGDPRKYGFHATLKAPLSLAAGTGEAELLAACESFADEIRPIPVIKPVVRSIGDFIAIVPSEHSAELEQLAAECVDRFDRFRAPLTPHDRARRHPDRLTPRQREHLDRWGYPYVMEDFRFHMTLTGRLGAERREAILPILRERFAALGIATFAIDRVAVFRQDDANSPFRIVQQYALAPAGA